MRIIQFMDSLGFARGGLTSAIYDRLALIPDSVPLTIAVTGRQFGVTSVFESLKAQGAFPKHATLRAFYDEEFQTGAVVQAPLDKLTNGCHVTREPVKGGSVVRYFDSLGRFIRLERLSSDGKKIIEEHHNPRKPHEIDYRVYFDEDGYRRRVEWFDSGSKPRYETLYRSDGTAFSSCWINESGSRYRTTFFDRRTGVARLVQHDNGLRITWIEELLNSDGEVIALSDEPATIFALSESRPIANVHGLAVIHTVHYANNVDDTEGFRGWFPYYRVGRGNVSEIIALTEVQRKALEADGTNIGKESESVITHPAPDWRYEPHRESTQKLLYLGRLHKDKRVDLVVQAFSLVAADYPNAELQIVGSGPQEEELRALVRKLGIENRVEFHGYTAAVEECYRAADALLLLSKYDGLGLVLLEGFAASIPAIATAATFGPAELVEHESNGLIVEPDESSVADAIKRILGDNELRLRLSAGASNSARKYSHERWATEWMRKLRLISPED